MANQDPEHGRRFPNGSPGSEIIAAEQGFPSSSSNGVERTRRKLAGFSKGGRGMRCQGKGAKISAFTRGLSWSYDLAIVETTTGSSSELMEPVADDL